MSKGRKVTPKSADEFNMYLKSYLSVMEITFVGVESITFSDHVISSSKCYNLVNADIDNGRIINAESFTMMLTNIDLETYMHFYRFKKIHVLNMYVYRKGYLPTDFVKAVLELYMRKTTLKGIEGKEAEYLWAKECANACYGMIVTDICRGEITYENGKGWSKVNPDVENEIRKYNDKRDRFLFYPWGVFITAYARRNLASGILACGDGTGHYCYCDTDSVKVLFADMHKDYFKQYNEYITNKIKAACEFHGIDYETMCNPCDVKGNHHPLGVWDYEGTYRRAKFLGAKRYAVETQDGKHSITIAGVNKKTAIPYLERKSQEEHKDFFEYMEFGFVFNEDACGKLLHTYCDEPRTGSMIDYRGVKWRYSERSYVHLEPTTYEMNATKDYLDLLLSDKITEEERYPG